MWVKSDIEDWCNNESFFRKYFGCCNDNSWIWNGLSGCGVFFGYGDSISRNCICDSVCDCWIREYSGDFVCDFVCDSLFVSDGVVVCDGVFDCCRYGYFDFNGGWDSGWFVVGNKV